MKSLENRENAEVGNKEKKRRKENRDKTTVETYDKKLHYSVPESGHFLFFGSKFKIPDMSS